MNNPNVLIIIVQLNSLQSQIKDKEKNEASLRSVKARKIILQDRIEKQMKDYKELRRKFDSMVKEIADLRNQEKSNFQGPPVTRIYDEVVEVQTKIEDLENYLKRGGNLIEEKEFKEKSSSFNTSLHQALKRLQTQ